MYNKLNLTTINKTLLQRGSGSPEPLDQAVELSISRGTDMGMELEQEEREGAVALAKAMETAVANSLSVGAEAGLREISDWHWNAFTRGLRGDPSARGDPPARVEPLTVTF